jgi:uncharacterized protein YdhG (YjbR/CyaY superfamily)
MSLAVMEAHAAELKAYDTSKGTIRFPPSKPLPAALVRKLVRARIAENEAAEARRREARKAAQRRSREEKQRGRSG